MPTAGITGPRLPPATCCAGGRHQPRDAAPARRVSATEALALAPGCEPPACAAGCSPGTASSRTTPGWSPTSPARRRRTAPTCAPGPGCCPATGTAVELRDELDRRHDDRARAGRGQRHRRLGGRPGRRGEAAAEPRHPPRARAGTIPGCGRGHRAGPGRDQPVRVRAAAARRHHLRRPHRRARRRRRSPTCPSPRSPRSASCSTWSPRRSTGRCAAPTWSARTPGCGRCSTRETARPPTCPAGTRCSPRATGVVTVVGGKLTTYRRMAEDAVDAAVGRRRARRRPCRTRTLPLLGAARGPSSPRLEPGPAGAPLRHRGRAGARRAPATSAASPTRSCSPRSPTAVPATLAELLFGDHPRGRRRRRRPARPAYPDRPGPRGPRLARPAAERALSLANTRLR